MMQTISPFLAGKPVWPKGRAEQMNDFIGFTAAFQAPRGARLRLTGSTIYRVKLNDQFVAYGPARAPKGVFRVDELQLPVRPGENRLCIEVQGSNANSYYYMKQPSFLQAEVVSDGQVLAATGRDFLAWDLTDASGAGIARIVRSPRFSYQRMFAENYILRTADRPARLDLEERPAVALLPRMVPQPEYLLDHSYKPVRQIRRRYNPNAEIHYMRFLDRVGEDGFDGYRPEELTMNSYSETQRYEVDPQGDILSTVYEGRLNNTGFIRLKVDCKAPGRLVVLFAEIAQDDGSVAALALTSVNAIYCDIRNPGIYELEAFEANTFKVAEIFMDGGHAKVLDFSLREFKSILAWNVPFKIDDPDLAAIFQAGRETYAANAVDCFTDCPSRERAAWLCDSFFTARSSYLLTGNTLMERFFLENFAYADTYENLPKGAIPMVYPGDHPTGTFIPNWCLWLVLEVEEYLKRSGDHDLVLAFKDKLLGLMHYLDGFLNSDGLLEKLPKWVFVEWSQANSFVQDVNYPSNMTYAAVLDTLARLYQLPELSSRAEAMRETIRRQSWNGQWFQDHANRQADGSLAIPPADITETCQYYAFYFKVATPASHPELWNRLLTEFGPQRAEKGLWSQIWPSNAFIGNYMRLDLLANAGLHEQLLRESVGYFKKMADKTGTLWEHDSTKASCCHGFASYINVLLNKAMGK